MKWFWIIFSILTCLGITPEARAEKGAYFVEKVKGTILVRDPFDAAWKRVVVGQSITEGALIQMDEGAILKVKGVKRYDHIPKGIQLKADVPTVTRLEQKSIRKLKLGGYFVPLPGGMNKDEKKGEGEEEEEEFTLARAWQQAISILDDSESQEGITQDTMTAKPGKPDINATPSEESEGFKVLHPAMGATLIVGELPTEVVIVFEDLWDDKYNPEYRLLLWRDNETPNKSLAITSESRYVASATSEGRYYLKVETVDGRFRSQTYSFSVVVVE